MNPVTPETEALLVLEAIRVEPRIADVLHRAEIQQNVPGYHRVHTYYDLKRSVNRLVGFFAECPEVRPQKYYRAVCGALADLLPLDELDMIEVQKGKAIARHKYHSQRISTESPESVRRRMLAWREAIYRDDLTDPAMVESTNFVEVAEQVNV